MKTQAPKEIISRKDIVQLVSAIVSNWYILVVLPLIAFGISYVYTHRLPEVYAAKCQILLKSNETYDYQQKINRGLGLNSSYANYEQTASQMRVIKSSNLINEVLNRLSLDVAYYIVGRIKVTEVYQHMPFKVETDERSSAFSGMRFNLGIIDESSFELRYEFEGVSHIAQYEFGELILDDGLYLKVQKQPNLNEVSLATLSQIDYEFRIFKKNGLIQKYKSNIEVSNIDYTSIIEVTLRDQIPERSQEVLDTLAKIYVANTIDNQNEINQNTLNYIDKQLNEVVEIINEIEGELEAYKQNKSILNLTKEEDNYFNRLVDLENRERKYQMDIRAINDLTTYLLGNEDVESLLPPSIFVSEDDPQLKQRVLGLYELRSEYNRMITSGTTNNPLINTTRKKIEAQKKEILQYLNTKKIALNEAIDEIDKEISGYELRLQNIPRTQRQLLNIERRLEVNEELYSFLLSKRAETIIAKAGLIPETKIIEQARSLGVVYPNKTRMNLINVLVGLGLAILIVVMKELFFQKIKTLGQLQSMTDISILGSIPKKTDFSKTYRILSGSERGNIVQAFRTLRTNLEYFAPSRAAKRILVTSLLAGEGKTFTSVNLASVLAIANKRVLIVDFDLHKPRLAKAMELDNSKGLSSFLAGQDRVEEIIRKTEVPTLDVITSGPVPPNASELILRDELNDLFKYVDEHYDFIFFDTPPITLITDGVFLMKYADVKVFVLNSKSTSKTSVDYIERLIEENHLENCALVLNEEKQTKLSYYYSRYGYGGYGYGGYGYGGYDSTYGDNV